MLFAYDQTRLAEATAELDDWKVRLDYKGPLHRAWLGRLRRDLEAEAVAASTSMEGVPVTVDEVRQILAGEQPASTRNEDAALVRGYRDAMSFVLRRADDTSLRWDPEMIVGLHDRVLAGNWAAGAGRFREGPAHVVDGRTGDPRFEAPPPDLVPGLVARACQRMEEGHPHAAIAAAWIHVTLAGIHPFRDGNGRAARVLASLGMYRAGFKLPEFTSLEEWWGRHLRAYYAAFECLGRSFDADADVTPFLEAHVDAQLHQVRALDLRERTQRRIWSALVELVESVGLETRVVNALWDAFFGREVTPRYYRPLADISAATATNDLAAAVAAGMLRPVGQGRSRRYVAADELMPLIGSRIGVTVDGSDDAARAVIVAELTKRTIAVGE
jgi:Fic family protein